MTELHSNHIVTSRLDKIISILMEKPKSKEIITRRQLKEVFGIEY